MATAQCQCANRIAAVSVKGDPVGVCFRGCCGKVCTKGKGLYRATEFQEGPLESTLVFSLAWVLC